MLEPNGGRDVARLHDLLRKALAAGDVPEELLEVTEEELEALEALEALDRDRVNKLKAAVIADTRCTSCGCGVMWAPTFCNFPHCADCFEPLDANDSGCSWDGVEHSDYESLPGNVIAE